MEVSMLISNSDTPIWKINGFLFLAPSVVFGAEAHLLQFEQVHVFWPFSSYLGNQQDVLFGELPLTFGGQTNNSTSQNGPQTYLTDQFVRCLHLI